jgi:hypothetical protein
MRPKNMMLRSSENDDVEYGARRNPRGHHDRSTRRRLAIGPYRAAHLLSRHHFHGLFRLPAALAPEYQGPADHHCDRGCGAKLRSLGRCSGWSRPIFPTVRHTRAPQRRIIRFPALLGLGGGFSQSSRRCWPASRSAVGTAKRPNLLALMYPESGGAIGVRFERTGAPMLPIHHKPSGFVSRGSASLATQRAQGILMPNSGVRRRSTLKEAPVPFGRMKSTTWSVFSG